MDTHFGIFLPLQTEILHVASKIKQSFLPAFGQQVDLESTFTFRNSKQTYSGIPIIVANMDTVGTFEMAVVMSQVSSALFFLNFCWSHYAQIFRSLLWTLSHALVILWSEFGCNWTHPFLQCGGDTIPSSSLIWRWMACDSAFSELD